MRWREFYVLKGRTKMSTPKLIIATDGNHTAALLGDVVIGQGIQRLDFTTEGDGGEMRSTLRILDLDIKTVEISTNKRRFMDWVNGNGK